jgi:hypothetical protein
MADRVFGVATYKAYRLLGIVHLNATGTFANINDKADFDRLPFLINPPMYGFYFIKPETALPATLPFVYEEKISFPKDQHFIRIQDANGFIDVPIAEVVVEDFNVNASALDKGNNFCVFRGFGINPLLSAECNAPLPKGYERVFGPDTIERCNDYIKANGGL